MEVGLDVAEKTLEDLEKEVTCAICQELYTDPKILPCLHCYCKECILELAKTTGKDKPFSCPECRKDTTFPEGGVEELKSAFIINRLKSMYLKHKKALSTQAQCEMCKSDAPAELFCKQCDKLACKTCAHMHTEMSALFDGHILVPINQLQKIKATEFVPKTPAIKKSCPVHAELLKMFCFDCKKLICRDCTLKDHKDHDFEFNNVAADNKKKELIKSLKPLREVEDSLSRALEEVHNTEHEVEAQGDSVANTIETSFEELHTILETCKKQLLQEAKRRVRKKIENLKGQEKNLSIASAGVRSVIDYTEQCVRHCSDEEVMSMYTEISRQIQHKVKEHSKTGNRLELVEKADMGVEVKCAENLHQLCQKAKITPAEIYYTVSNVPTTAEVDEEIKVEVVDTIKVTKSRLHLQCQVKCVPTGAVSKPEIEVKTPDRYQISYTPSVRGCHELSISAYGQPVQGSPFTTTVYMSPTQLDKPVKVWGGVTKPFSIAINSVGEIIVAEWDQDIVVFDNEGKIMGRIKQSQHRIYGLRSVAVDNEDNIYFIGDYSNKIGKANKNCNILLLRYIQVTLRGRGYYDIAVYGDEVMVTEFKNDGYIMVYDRELNYVRQIASMNKTKLRCLYPDHHGNLYISDADNTIQVLSKTDDFIRSISRDHNGVQQLKNPWMVHVCGNYVYVADNTLKKTVVFTTEGDYVTTFGCYGDVCVNQDGILYKCDYFKNNLTCY